MLKCTEQEGPGRILLEGRGSERDVKPAPEHTASGRYARLVSGKTEAGRAVNRASLAQSCRCQDWAEAIEGRMKYRQHFEITSQTNRLCAPILPS